MNIAKNMEAIFFAAIALISVTSFATAKAPVSLAAPAALTAPADAGMQVVTITAKRMSAAEKAAAQ